MNVRAALNEAAATLVIETLSDPRNTTAIESADRQIDSETARLDMAIAEAVEAGGARGSPGAWRDLAQPLRRGHQTLDARSAKLKAERDPLPRSRFFRYGDAAADGGDFRAVEAVWDAADHKERRDLLKMRYAVGTW